MRGVDLTVSVKVLGVAGGFGSKLTELGKILLANIVARQMQHGVLQGTSVSIGQDESITVDPGRIFA